MNFQQVFITIILIAAVVFVIYLYAKLAKKPSQKWKNEVKRMLVGLDARMTTADSVTLKANIIDADKLLDQTLKYKKIKGVKMGERLKNAKKHFSNWQIYSKAWEGHKLRNKIAHEIRFEPKVSELNEKYWYISNAITDLLK